jgi:hypothetical protein
MKILSLLRTSDAPFFSLSLYLTSLHSKEVYTNNEPNDGYHISLLRFLPVPTFGTDTTQRLHLNSYEIPLQRNNFFPFSGGKKNWATTSTTPAWIRRM